MMKRALLVARGLGQPWLGRLAGALHLQPLFALQLLLLQAQQQAGPGLWSAAALQPRMDAARLAGEGPCRRCGACCANRVNRPTSAAKGSSPAALLIPPPRFTPHQRHTSCASLHQPSQGTSELASQQQPAAGSPSRAQYVRDAMRLYAVTDPHLNQKMGRWVLEGRGLRPRPSFEQGPWPLAPDRPAEGSPMLCPMLCPCAPPSTPNPPNLRCPT